MWRRLYTGLKFGIICSTSIVYPSDLYSWGWNNFGQLGIGNSVNQFTPQLVPIQNVVYMTCKSNVSAAIDKDGKLYTWGRSKFGLLGNGYSDNVNTPTLVESLKDIRFIQVSCGQYHMAAITENGELYTWGDSANGKLGHSHQDKIGSREAYDFNKNLGSIKLPQKVELPTKVKQVAMGDQFTIILTENGQVFSVGQNKKGVLGIDTQNIEEIKFQEIKELSSKNIVKIDCGSDFSVALDVDGNLYAWGSNYFGQLGTASPSVLKIPSQIKGLQNLKDFSCGDQFVGAIDSNGHVYAWGYGSDGQLGQAGRSDIPIPHKIEFDQVVNKISCGLGHVGLISNSKLFMYGRGKEGQLGRGQLIESSSSIKLNPQQVMERVIRVSCGGSHTLALVN